MKEGKQVVLALNPGSTSTKLALFTRAQAIWQRQLDHPSQDIAQFSRVAQQYQWRLSQIQALLTEAPPALELVAVVGRGGLLKPLDGGTYRVNQRMIKELCEAQRGEHASNLGALLAEAIAREFEVPSFIVDPVVVDELEDYARISGWPPIARRSVFHALNHKAVARRAALKLGRPYAQLGLVVAHLGGGITVGAHRDGRVIEVNNGLDGEGPFSPERSGSLPVTGLVKYAANYAGPLDELRQRLAGRGGLVDHLATNDAREVECRLAQGEQEAHLVYLSMAYQIAKEIGRQVAALGRPPDAIILTGGLAASSWLVEQIRCSVGSFSAHFLVYPGEDELSALADGTWRVLDAVEEALDYE